MIVQCCKCKRFHLGDEWVCLDTAPENPLETSHGYCPACAQSAFEETDSDKPRLRQKAAVRSASNV